MGALVIIGDSLREAFFMWWETLWALVLGFGLSGLRIPGGRCSASWDAGCPPH